MLLSIVLLRWLTAWQPLTDMPMNVPVNPDVKVYAVALLLALVSGLLFGIVPVRQVLQANPYQIVKSGSTGPAGRRFTARDLLLVLQIAICAVLVTSSLVAVRGMVRSLHSDFGFQPQGAVIASTDLDMAGYSGDHVPAMQRRMQDTLETLPGVTAVGFIDRLPLAMEWSDQGVFKEDATDLRSRTKAMDAVIPGYFSRVSSSGRHDSACGQRLHLA